ncbi:MAG TPA: efflux RND transporter periplasmic adaptor subunit [Chitinispirillaceae bacterium]|nr:efflux RND transporter periplasmic adaptor subunit [Chitinispirillaceae bacterium]
MNKLTLLKEFACLGVLVFITGCKPPARPHIQRVLPVQVYKAQPDSISAYITLTGSIEAQNDAVVYSKVSEKLISLNVKPGDNVTAGQLLGTQYHQAALQGKSVAAAALKSAQVQLQTSSDDYNRMKNLYDKKAISRQQYDQSKSQYEIAQATFEQAQASLEQASVQVENSILRAPFDGKVAIVNYEINQMINQGQPVIQIINAHTVKAKLTVPSTDINKINLNKKVTAMFPSLPDTEFTGTVYRMDEAIDPLTRTLNVEVRLSNQGNLLRSGLFGEFRVETTRHTATVVVSEMTVMTSTEISTDALGIQTEKSEHYIYLVSSGKALRRSVTPGIISSGLVELASGVSFGDSIIVAGQNAVKDGDTLNVINKTER